MTWALGYGVALATTLLAEVPLTWAYAVWRLDVPPRRALSAAVGVNLLSHPLLTVVLLASPATPTLIAAEVGVVAIEGWLFRQWWPREGLTPYAVALAANAGSLALGTALWGMPW